MITNINDQYENKDNNQSNIDFLNKSIEKNIENKQKIENIFENLKVSFSFLSITDDNDHLLLNHLLETSFIENLNKVFDFYYSHEEIIDSLFEVICLITSFLFMKIQETPIQTSNPITNVDEFLNFLYEKISALIEKNIFYYNSYFLYMNIIENYLFSLNDKEILLKTYSIAMKILKISSDILISSNNTDHCQVDSQKSLKIERIIEKVFVALKNLKTKTISECSVLSKSINKENIELILIVFSMVNSEKTILLIQEILISVSICWENNQFSDENRLKYILISLCKNINTSNTFLLFISNMIDYDSIEFLKGFFLIKPIDENYISSILSSSSSILTNHLIEKMNYIDLLLYFTRKPLSIINHNIKNEISTIVSLFKKNTLKLFTFIMKNQHEHKEEIFGEDQIGFVLDMLMNEINSCNVNTYNTHTISSSINIDDSNKDDLNKLNSSYKETIPLLTNLLIQKMNLRKENFDFQSYSKEIVINIDNINRIFDVFYYIIEKDYSLYESFMKIINFFQFENFEKETLNKISMKFITQPSKNALKSYIRMMKERIFVEIDLFPIENSKRLLKRNSYEMKKKVSNLSLLYKYEEIILFITKMRRRCDSKKELYKVMNRLDELLDSDCDSEIEDKVYDLIININFSIIDDSSDLLIRIGHFISKILLKKQSNLQYSISMLNCFLLLFFTLQSDLEFSKNECLELKHKLLSIYFKEFSSISYSNFLFFILNFLSKNSSQSSNSEILNLLMFSTETNKKILINLSYLLSHDILLLEEINNKYLLNVSFKLFEMCFNKNDSNYYFEFYKKGIFNNIITNLNHITDHTLQSFIEKLIIFLKKHKLEDYLKGDDYYNYNSFYISVPNYRLSKNANYYLFSQIIKIFSKGLDQEKVDVSKLGLLSYSLSQFDYLINELQIKNTSSSSIIDLNYNKNISIAYEIVNDFIEIFYKLSLKNDGDSFKIDSILLNNNYITYLFCISNDLMTILNQSTIEPYLEYKKIHQIDLFQLIDINTKMINTIKNIVFSYKNNETNQKINDSELILYTEDDNLPQENDYQTRYSIKNNVILVNNNEDDSYLYTICDEEGNNKENPYLLKDGTCVFENQLIKIIQKFEEYLPSILSLFKKSNDKNLNDYLSKISKSFRIDLISSYFLLIFSFLQSTFEIIGVKLNHNNLLSKEWIQSIEYILLDSIVFQFINDGFSEFKMFYMDLYCLITINDDEEDLISNNFKENNQNSHLKKNSTLKKKITLSVKDYDIKSVIEKLNTCIKEAFRNNQSEISVFEYMKVLSFINTKLQTESKQVVDLLNLKYILKILQEVYYQLIKDDKNMKVYVNYEDMINNVKKDNINNDNQLIECNEPKKSKINLKQSQSNNEQFELNLKSNENSSFFLFSTQNSTANQINLMQVVVYTLRLFSSISSIDLNTIKFTFSYLYYLIDSLYIISKSIVQVSEVIFLNFKKESIFEIVLTFVNFILFDEVKSKLILNHIDFNQACNLIDIYIEDSYKVKNILMILFHKIVKNKSIANYEERVISQFQEILSIHSDDTQTISIVFHMLSELKLEKSVVQLLVFKHLIVQFNIIILKSSIYSNYIYNIHSLFEEMLKVKDFCVEVLNETDYLMNLFKLYDLKNKEDLKKVLDLILIGINTYYKFVKLFLSSMFFSNLLYNLIRLSEKLISTDELLIKSSFEIYLIYIIYIFNLNESRISTCQSLPTNTMNTVNNQNINENLKNPISKLRIVKETLVFLGFKDTLVENNSNENNFYNNKNDINEFLEMNKKVYYLLCNVYKSNISKNEIVILILKVLDQLSKLPFFHKINQPFQEFSHIVEITFINYNENFLIMCQIMNIIQVIVINSASNNEKTEIINVVLHQIEKNIRRKDVLLFMIETINFLINFHNENTYELIDMSIFLFKSILLNENNENIFISLSELVLTSIEGKSSFDYKNIFQFIEILYEKVEKSMISIELNFIKIITILSKYYSKEIISNYILFVIQKILSNFPNNYHYIKCLEQISKNFYNDKHLENSEICEKILKIFFNHMEILLKNQKGQLEMQSISQVIVNFSIKSSIITNILIERKFHFSLKQILEEKVISNNTSLVYCIKSILHQLKEQKKENFNNEKKQGLKNMKLNVKQNDLNSEQKAFLVFPHKARL